jgi:hypothetical protein
MKRVFSGLLVVALVGLGIFTTGCGTMIAPPADTTAPTVSSTSPANGNTGVAINKKISAVFSEAMDPLTIGTGTFTLKKGATAVAGSVAYTGVTAVFTPASNLDVSTAYTATITTGAKDLAGNALAVTKTWSFITGTSTDTTAPTVIATINANGATGVARNTKVGATFSETMDPTTITDATFTFKQGTTVVAGAISYSGVNLVFTPASLLAANTTYTCTITTGAKDLAGNALAADYVWSWTTGAVSDTTAPTVITTIPADLAENVSVSTNLAASFSKAMDPLTINTLTFTLMNGATTVEGDVTYVDGIATFDPIGDLASNTIYTAKVTTGAKDIVGNALAADKVWSFKTATVAGAGPAPVVLGLAGDFAILSKSGIALAVGGTARVHGNIGVSPAAATFITNAALILDIATGTFATSTQVPGYKAYASDYTAPTPDYLTTAIGNMETAFTDAAGRSTAPVVELSGGHIGGLTLAPGLYKWTTDVDISTDLYLSGGVNDVWIFQCAQNFVLANGIHVHLSGGAVAKNIYWQVSGNATLGTTSVMNGNMICLTDMTMFTGATLNGRLLAQTAVTLQENTIVNLP